MHALSWLILAAPLLARCTPHPSEQDKRDDGGHDPTPSECTIPSPTSSCDPVTTPTKAYTVTAAAPGLPIDHLPMNAVGRGFRLGGNASTYCPTSVGASCPPGNETVFAGGSISVLVPGGQQQYTEPSGRVGFTQAHSISMPIGSLPGGFGYKKCPGEEYGHIVSGVFAGTGFMACPDSLSDTKFYSVYVNIPNAVVPSGEVKDCIPFDGLTTDYNGPLPAAWQYG
jgi:hypothetical protein